MELNEQEAKYFETGGEAEVADTEVTETTETVETETLKTEEKKRPSKFTYSEDTDNVLDDLGRKYVPLNAVQEARSENKQLKKLVDDLQGKFGRFEEGEKKLQSLLSRLQGDETKPPEYDKDPLGHFKHENESLKKEIDELKKGLGETKTQTEQQRQFDSFQRTVTSAEASFASKNADYSQAAAHLRNMWKEELTEAGVPEDQLEQALFMKGAQFAGAALKRGANPAEAVYNLAKRIGYKASDDGEKKLKQIAEGQEASRSLAGAKAKGGFSLESLASMSDEDMEALVADPKKWNALSKA